MSGRLRGFIGKYSAPLRLTAQLVIAGEFTYLMTGWIGLPQAIWAVFTSIIVIQSNVGSSLKAAIDRLIGTLAGAAIGFAVASVEIRLPQIGPYVLLIALAPTGLLAALNPSFRIAPVTAAIMLLSKYGLSPFATALDRVFEISVGGVIGIMVSVLILPARAHKNLYTEISATLAAVADALILRVGTLSAPVDPGAASLQQAKAKAHLAAAEKLEGEARQERRARLTDERDPSALVRTCRRLYTNLLILNRALDRPHDSNAMAIAAGPLIEASESIAVIMRAFGTALQEASPPPSLDAVDVALAAIDAALADIRQKHVLRDLPGAQVQDLFTLMFVFHQFRRDLKDMQARVGEVAAEGAAQRLTGGKNAGNEEKTAIERTN